MVECGHNNSSSHLLQEINLGTSIVKQLIISPHAYYHSCFSTVDNQLYSTGDCFLTNIQQKFAQVDTDSLWSSRDDLKFIMGLNSLLVIKSM
jgi:hypothetical protein